MIRSTDFLTWKDPSHWMEAMKGARWNARVKEENAAFEEILEECGSTTESRKLFARYQEEHDKECTFLIEHGMTKLKITVASGNTYKMSWPRYKKAEIIIGDVDTTRNGYVVYTHDISHGGEEYEVVAMNHTTVLWRFNGRSHGVASDVVILGDRVYLLEAHGPLQYKWLVSLDLETGAGKRIHYNETRDSIALSLIRGENGCVFLEAENAGVKNLFHVKPNGQVQPLSPKGRYFHAVGYARGSTEPCYFVKGSVGARWEPRGKALTELKFSQQSLASVFELVVLNCGLVVYIKQGERILELCTKRSTKQIGQVLGEIHIHNWPIWYGYAGYTKPVEFTFVIPGKSPVKALYSVAGGLTLNKAKVIYSKNVLTGLTTSADGEKVRWLLTSNQRPKALLVIGYGAYGLTTPYETTRWRPYIEQGFAIVFALIRGGGDHTDEWAQKGKVQGKLQGIEDFEACIRAVQKITRIPPSATCIFGRSAGGFLVGAAIVRNPTGELFSSVYAEVPYVDVLQTAANEDLPLTKFEYNEFGDPAHKIADFEFLLRLSPVCGLGPGGAPNIFVVCRAGINDRQVFAYESVKWMDALRKGGGVPKLLHITGGVGHVVHGEQVYKQRAEDFVILCKKLLG